ncbi:MAG: 3'-5' exonuclease [Oscillospiraceae bacterium]|nr:3'-5' exonuclease [Oscillospiraceae bacterium]
MSICPRCGRKGLFLEVSYKSGVCRNCEIELSREAEEREYAEHLKKVQERKAFEEEQDRLRTEKRKRDRSHASALYNSLKTHFKLSNMFEMAAGVEAAEQYRNHCMTFCALCDQAATDDIFLALCGRQLMEERPLGGYLPCESACEYLRTRKDAVAGILARAEKFIACSRDFASVFDQLPRVEIFTAACSFFPDPDPDYTGVNFTNVTARTNYEKVSDFTVIDVETTGLSAYRNEIVQLSAVKFHSFEPCDCFTTYIKPKKGINEDAARMNGITAELTEPAPQIEDVINCFRDYIGNTLPLVGHNLLFDLKFLGNSGCVTLDTKRKYYDTLPLSRKAYTSDRYALDYLDKAALSIYRDCAHDSLSDCLVTGLLFHDICKSLIKDCHAGE